MQNRQEVRVKKQRKSNAGFMLLVIMLIAIIMISSSMGLFAWAKYKSNVNGTANGQVAKWHFELKPGTVQGTELENFAITRTDGYVNVASDRLAPGTKGIIPIEIDTTGTEVTMVYEIDVQLKNCPKNIKFYADSDRTQPLAKTEEEANGEPIDVVKISKYLSLDIVEGTEHTEVDDVHNETIYWEWPYETELDDGTGNKTLQAGDVQDTLDQGKIVMMNIVVRGVQVTENPYNTLAYKIKIGEVQIGDIVKYNPLQGMSEDDIATVGTYEAKATSTEEEMNASKDNPTTGWDSDQVFNVNTNKITTWRVLSVKDNGEVELMGITPETIRFKGQAGYNNGIAIMNNVASIYGHGAGATGARSMTVEDVDKYTSFDKNKYSGYGSTQQYTFNNAGSFTGIHDGVNFTVEDKDGNLIEDMQGRTNLTKGSVATIQKTYYYYSIDSYKKAKIPDSVYSMLTADNYWLASRYCYVSSGSWSLGLRYVNIGYVNGGNLFEKLGHDDSRNLAVAPVVSLRSNIQIKGGNSSGWELDI